MRKVGELLFVRNASLLTKVAIPVVAAVLVILGIMTVLYVRTLSMAINDEYQERGLAYIESFDQVGYQLDDYQGSSRLQTHVENLKNSNQDIYRLTVYAIKNGAPVRVASSEANLIGEGADSQDLEPITTDKIVYFDQVKEGENFVEILAPLHVNGEAVASIGIYFRLSPRDAMISNLAKVSIAISIVGALLLLLVLDIVIKKGFMNPIASLEKATLDLAAGYYNRRIVVSRRDELGRLALQFNRMAEVLEQKEKENLVLHQELEERFQVAREQAERDPLTGLHNHRTFQERLYQEIARAERFGHSLSLLFLDIDHFKVVNDTRGHQFGDTVLQNFGELLGHSVRQVDIAGRYGGEEFGVILPETDGESAYDAAERLRKLIASYKFGEGSGSPSSVTVSIGVSSFPGEAHDREELIREADLAMYFAKQLGRNQVRSYAEIMKHAERGGLPEIRQTVEVLQQTVEDACLHAVHSLAAAVDDRNKYTHSHSQAVSKYAEQIARKLGFEGEQLREIRIAGLLHDIGKIGIPDEILEKPGPLTTEEWELMRQHPVLGKMIVQRIASLGQLVPFIEHHQERYDGTGYPSGLAGDAIPLGARILAVADAYHAMTTDRPYRTAMTHEEAVAELSLCAGAQFDPLVVKAFIEELELESKGNGRTQHIAAQT